MLRILRLRAKIVDKDLGTSTKMVSIFKDSREGTIFSRGGGLISMGGYPCEFGFHQNITREEAKAIIQRGGGVKEVVR